jgi:DNA-binding MarR family transcriptional regulator
MPAMARAREQDDAAKQRAWRLFVETYGAVFGRLSEEIEAQTGLPIAWYDVLLHLDEAPDDGLRMRDLADAVVISKSGLTGLVDRMEAAGLVARRPDPADRRAIAVTLTAEGRRRFRVAARRHREDIARHFAAHLTVAEAEAMAATLRKLKAAIDADRPTRRSAAGGRGQDQPRHADRDGDAAASG